MFLPMHEEECLLMFTRGFRICLLDEESETIRFRCCLLNYGVVIGNRACVVLGMMRNWLGAFCVGKGLLMACGEE